MGWKAIVVDALRCNNRYLSFLCGLCLMTAAGTEYMFSTYAPDLKDLMEYEQTEINFVGTCTNLGIYLGFYMGILHDYTNARLTCLVGAVFLFVGWFFAYLATINYFDSSYVLMGLFMFIQGNGCNALYTAALANNIKKFPPKYRGTVVGFLVSMFGLSSAIFSPIYVYGFQSDVQTFFLFFAILTPSIAFLGVIFLSVPPKEEIVKEIKEEESEKIEKVKTLNIIKEEVNTAKIFLRLDFWLLFFVFMLGAGVGLTIINNLGSMVESAGGTSASSLVTFLSIFNCLGRIISGLVSDVCLKYNILSRLGVLTISLALMALSQIYFVLVLSLDSVPVLYPGVAFVGLTYGALMSLSPSIATELFGQKYFGGNWSIVRISPAFSSFVMATVIAGRLYERNEVEGTNDCYGWKCYGWSISVDFFICVFTTFLCFIMAVRWFLFVKRRQKKGLLSDFSE